MKRTAKCPHCNKRQYPDELELHAKACLEQQERRRAWFKTHVIVDAPASIKDKLTNAIEDKVAKG